MNTQLEKLPKTGRIRVDVSVSADMNFTSFAAKKRANRYLADEVNMFMFGGEPSLVVSDHLYWRIPVIFALTGGMRGEVGYIDVNVEKGGSGTTSQPPEELNCRAEALTLSSAPSFAARSN